MNKTEFRTSAVIVATSTIILSIFSAGICGMQSANAIIEGYSAEVVDNNIYVSWWTNNTANQNYEVMFSASTDAGKTFGDPINLSNTADAYSTRLEIDSDADNVVVTWWETNETSHVPVMRVSNDNGETFGPLLKHAINGTKGG